MTYLLFWDMSGFKVEGRLRDTFGFVQDLPVNDFSLSRQLLPP